MWYVRRRNVHYKADVVATSVLVLRDEVTTERAINERLSDTDLTGRFRYIKRRGTTAAEAEAMSMLSAPSFVSGSDTLIKAAVSELAGLDTVTRESVMKTAERFADPEFGEGIARLERENPEFKESDVVDSLGGSGKVPELDRLARTLPEPELKALSTEIVEAAKSGDKPQTDKVAKIITERELEVGSAGGLTGTTTPVT